MRKLNGIWRTPYQHEDGRTFSIESTYELSMGADENSSTYYLIVHGKNATARQEHEHDSLGAAIAQAHDDFGVPEHSWDEVEAGGETA